MALVLINQIGTLVAIRLATGVNASTSAEAGATVYANAFTVFMLPQSVITVSVVTALLPQLSGLAADGHLDVVRERLGWALRTTGALIVPLATSLIVLGIPVAVLLFRHGDFSSDAARTLGLTLSAFAVGLPAFSAYYVLLRGFYALEDTRTPTFNAVLLNAINILLAVIAVAVLDPSQAVPGLALAYALAYWIALIALGLQLRRRLGASRRPAGDTHPCPRDPRVAARGRWHDRRQSAGHRLDRAGRAATGGRHRPGSRSRAWGLDLPDRDPSPADR